MPTTSHQSLISLARIACDAAGPTERNELAVSLSNRSDLLACAALEGMDGLLQHWLHGEGLMRRVGPDLWERLQRGRVHRLIDYQLKHRALEELLLMAEQEQIRLLVLQGMAIADELYPPGVRPLSDIDLLVRGEEFERMAHLLSRLGYTAVSRYPPVYARGNVWIDLHQQLAYLSRVEPTVNPLRVNEERLWSAAVRRPLGAAQAWTLSPADHIVILSAHLQKHSFGRLIWFVDIGRLLNRFTERTPLEAILERAGELALDRPFYFVCAYLREVLKLPRLQSHPLPSPSLNWVERRLSACLLNNRRIDGMGELLYLMAIKPPLKRWRFLRHTLVPGAEMMREQVQSSSATQMTWGYLRRLGRFMRQAVRLTAQLGLNGLNVSR